MKRTSRMPSKLSESLQRHLNAYALAASAAGVGVLALAQPAEAKIVYTKTHHVIDRKNTTLHIDLNNDGVVNFQLTYIRGSSGGYLGVVGYTSARIWVSQIRYAPAFPAGVHIGPNGDWKKPPLGRAFMEGFGCGSLGCVSYGDWRDVKNRYLGLRFLANGKTHYGWARLNASLPPVSATLTGYAYETVPNKPIITGKTKGPDVITLNPGSLGALAAGASRRHR